MLQRGTVRAVIVALSLVLAACGGSADEATEDEASATSASTPASTPAPPAEATSDAASPTPTSAPAAADTPEPEPTPAGSESDDAAPDPAAVAEHLRARTMQMWDVYNTHDPDALKAFYEPGYWAEEEEEVRSNMNPFRTFGIEIRAEKASAPTEIAPGKWETRHTGHFPLGSVKMVFIWEEFEGEWLMTYAEVE